MDERDVNTWARWVRLVLRPVLRELRDVAACAVGVYGLVTDQDAPAHLTAAYVALVSPVAIRAVGEATRKSRSGGGK